MDMVDVYRLFLDTLITECRIRGGESILVCCSGGVDSMVLTHLMNRASSDLGLRLAILHVDHGIRGDASSRDAMFVKDVSRKLSMPFFLEELNLGSNLPNMEEYARIKRYRAITKCMSENSFEYAATGHTMDDQAETVIFRLVRGSGPRGMEGMHFRREDGIIRPLLGLTKHQLVAYARENNIDHVEDASNKDTHFARNLIRKEIIPMMKRINQGVVANVARFSIVASEENKVLQAIVRETLKKSIDLDWGVIKVLRLEEILRIPSAVAKRLVIGVVSDLLGEARGVDFMQVGMVMDVIHGKKRAHTIGRSVRIVRWGNKIAFHRAGPGPYYTHEIHGSGRVYLEEINRTLEIEFKEEQIRTATIRSWLPGDRIENKRVSQVLYSRGIIEPLRRFWPVIISQGDVIGLAGMDNKIVKMVFM